MTTATATDITELASSLITHSQLLHEEDGEEYATYLIRRSDMLALVTALGGDPADFTDRQSCAECCDPIPERDARLGLAQACEDCGLFLCENCYETDEHDCMSNNRAVPAHPTVVGMGA